MRRARNRRGKGKERMGRKLKRGRRGERGIGEERGRRGWGGS